ncbi:DUF2023 family protein [uncultured Ilyobacter sp.]|uniref:DUF2023 family protein n=1 Tax=uncultured Ilyobacter sp. TaxID=544433 RepID=UPI0029C83E2C|nr:DUF2023 family protein [uncultured Ilyobacter sp.]
MEVFVHHIYEYEKGLRNLVLHTAEKDNLKIIMSKLKNRKINYEIYEIEGDRINIFFGAWECVEVIRSIGKESLRDYTSEEDFILGIMLGYDRRKQCERYLDFKQRNKKTA